MNFLRPALALCFILIIAASGCIQAGVHNNNSTDSDKGILISDSGFFVTGEENRLKISVFESTIVENILSPGILRNLDQYPQINYEMSRILIPKGKENPPHCLNDTTEIIYILSGSAKAKVNEKLFNLTPGDTLFIPKNAVQEILNSEEGELSYLSVTDPPYKEENEIILSEDYNVTNNTENAYLIPAINTTEQIFFEYVEIYSIISPKILKNQGIETLFEIGVAKAVIPKGGLTTPHILEGTTEVMYIISGEGYLHVNKKTMVVKKGDTAYIPPGAYQSLENSGDNELIYLTITDPAYSESIDSSVSG